MNLKKAFFLITLIWLLIGNANTVLGAVSTQISDADFYKQINLDLPALSGVKQAVEANDYTLATTRLLDYYKVRTSPKWYNQPILPRVNASYSRIKADDIVNHIFTEISITACPDVPVGSGNINWLYTPNGDREWYWALNRQFHMKDLGTAYQETSDTKYALEFEKQFLDWAKDNPVPSTVDTIGAWRTIEAGLRLSESMLYYFNQFLYCNSISNDTKLAVLKTFYEHGEYLIKFSGSGNWLLFECKGLYSLAVVYPEFKRSSYWKTTALERVSGEINTQFLADGWQYELTPNYHLEALKSVQAIIDLATLNEETLPFSASLIKGYEVIANLLLPGGRLIPLNDTGWCLAYDTLRTATTIPGDYAKSSAFLYLASSSLSGKPDGLSTSAVNANAGVAHFRDYIGNGGIYGMFEGGPSGFGPHGFSSKDKLQFTLAGFDRELLIDPGVYSYAGQDIAQYMYTTPAHNTVTIDGYDQSRRSQDISNPDKNFEAYTGVGVDYAAGVYDEGYDEILRIAVKHKREVVYVKSGYFLVNDELTGSGQHTARQFWNFAPGSYNIDTVSKQVSSKFGDNNNVLIVPINPSEVALEYADGQQTPLRGWSSSGTNHAISTLNMDYKYTGTLPYKIQTLIVPYQGANPPVVTIEKAGYIKVNFGSYSDYILIGSSSHTYGDFSFSGKVAVIRSENGTLTNASYFPKDSNVLKGGQLINLPEINCRERIQVTSQAKTNGIYQAEWSDFIQVGNAKYTYDSLASARYAVSLTDSASIKLPVEAGLQTVKIKARTNNGTSIIALIVDGISKATFTITSESSYTKYTAVATGGRMIEVKVISGNSYIDSIELVGSGTKTSSKIMLRQRMPTQNAAISFGSDSYTDYTVSANLNLISPLSQKNSAQMGIRIRGDYSFYYDDGSKKLKISKGDVLLASCDIELDYTKWYTFSFSAVGTLLQGVVSEKDSLPIKLLCIYDSDYQSGIGQLFSDYADCGADNIKLTLLNGSIIFNENLEEYYSGLRPSNWTDTESGSWKTENTVATIADDELKLSVTPTMDYVDGDVVTFTYLGNNNNKTIALYDFDRLIASSSETYGSFNWTAVGGDHEFSVKSDQTVSNKISVRVSGVKKYTESLNINEHFDSYLGGLPTKAAGTGTMEANTYNLNKKMKLTNATISEFYYNFSPVIAGKLIFETEIIPLTTNVRTPVFVFKDSLNAESFLLLFNSNGEIVNKKTGLAIGKYYANTVYKIRMELDCSNSLWSLFINDIEVVTDDIMPNSMKNASRVYVVKMWDKGSLLLDNIKVGCLFDVASKKVIVENSSGKIFEQRLVLDDNLCYGVLLKNNVIDKIFNLSQEQNLLTVDSGNEYKIEILTWSNVNEIRPIKNKYVYFITS